MRRKSKTLGFNADQIFTDEELTEAAITLLSFTEGAKNEKNAPRAFLASPRSLSDTYHLMINAAKGIMKNRSIAEPRTKSEFINAANSASITHSKSILELHGINTEFLIDEGYEEHKNLSNEIISKLQEKKDDSFSAASYRTTFSEFKDKLPSELQKKIKETKAQSAEVRDITNPSSYLTREEKIPHDLLFFKKFGNDADRNWETTTSDTISILNLNKRPLQKRKNDMLVTGAEHIGLKSYANNLLRSQQFSGNLLKDLSAIRFLVQTFPYSIRGEAIQTAFNFHSRYDLQLNEQQRKSLIALERREFNDPSIGTPGHKVVSASAIKIKKDILAEVEQQLAIIFQLKNECRLRPEILLKFVKTFYPCLTPAKKKDFIDQILDEKTFATSLQIGVKRNMKKADQQQVISLIRKSLFAKLSDQKARHSTFSENCQQVAEQSSWIPNYRIFGMMARIFTKPNYTDSSSLAYNSIFASSSLTSLKQAATAFSIKIKYLANSTKKLVAPKEVPNIEVNEAKQQLIQAGFQTGDAPSTQPIKVKSAAQDSFQDYIRYNIFTKEFSNLSVLEQQKLYCETEIFTSKTLSG